MEHERTALQTLLLGGRNEAARAIAACGAVTAPYGLSLQRAEIDRLLAQRERVLQQTGRVEFGGTILPRLIRTFCASPYLQQQDYAQTLAALQEIFYRCKSESDDCLSDEEVLSLLRTVFDGAAQGSLDALEQVAMASARAARHGWEVRTDGKV